MNTTLEKPAIITEAAPLTISETSSLIALAASSERTARVKATGPRASRGWQLGGNVD
jgi:hypothetical protein